MNIQIKKGALEMCVLALLTRRDCYGFELVNALAVGVDISEGTIYPLLKRLKEDGLLTTYLKESLEGPPRKYYHIERSGIDEFKRMKNEWREFTDGVAMLLKEAETDANTPTIGTNSLEGATT